MRSGLPASVRHWIIVNAICVTALINVVVNAGIAWLSVGGRSQIPLWAPPLLGGPSTTTDTVATLFLLPFITCVVATAAVRHDLRRGSLQPLQRSALPLLARLPAGSVRRGAMLGVMSVAAFAPPAIVVLVAVHADDLSVSDFVIFKTLFAVVLGLLVTPLIAFAALSDSAARGPS